MTFSGDAFEPPSVFSSTFQMVECCGVHLVGPDDLWVRELEVDVYSVNFGVTYVA